MATNGQYYKEIYDDLDTIENLRREGVLCTIKKLRPYLERSFCYMSKLREKKGYTLTFKTIPIKRLSPREIIEDIVVEGKDSMYFIDRALILSSVFDEVVLSVDSFSTKVIKEEKEFYYRLVIPVEKSLDLRNHFRNVLPYKTKRMYSFGLIEIDIGEKTYHLYECDYHDKLYAIIECLYPETFQYFSKACLCISMCYGFITGYSPRNEGFYFTFNNDSFKIADAITYRSFANSIKSSYCAIHTSPSDFIEDRQLADQLKLKLSGIHKATFSNLCQKTLQNSDILGVLSLILEASTLSLQPMAASYSVALETLTTVICKENEEKVIPITNKKLARIIRKKFKKVLDTYKDCISENGNIVLSRKIENINQQTNRDKLSKPFELFGLELNEYDVRAIENRNDFLHGRLPGIEEGVFNFEEDYPQLYFTALRLYFLVTALVLKYVGFSGSIPNYTKLYEKVTKVKTEESYYREI